MKGLLHAWPRTQSSAHITLSLTAELLIVSPKHQAGSCARCLPMLLPLTTTSFPQTSYHQLRLNRQDQAQRSCSQRGLPRPQYLKCMALPAPWPCLAHHSATFWGPLIKLCLPPRMWSEQGFVCLVPKVSPYAPVGIQKYLLKGEQWMIFLMKFILRYFVACITIMRFSFNYFTEWTPHSHQLYLCPFPDSVCPLLFLHLSEPASGCLALREKLLQG